MRIIQILWIINHYSQVINKIGCQLLASDIACLICLQTEVYGTKQCRRTNDSRCRYYFIKLIVVSLDLISTLSQFKYFKP